MKFAKLIPAAAALLSLACVSSCSQEEESLIVAGAPVWNTGCAVQVPADLFLSAGTFDVRFETDYLLPLELQNQLLAQQPQTQNSSTDNSEMQLTGVDITISSAQRPDIIDQLRAENPAFVDFSPAVPTDSIPGSSSKGLIIQGIPAATAARLSALRVAEAVAAGESAVANALAENPDLSEAEIATVRRAGEAGVLGQQETYTLGVVVRARRTGNRVGSVGEFESREFEFPVQVCHGCLVSCATCSFDVDPDGDGMTEEIGGVCPAIVPLEPTQRLFRGNYLGANVGCPTAQDDLLVPVDPNCQ
ncbi:MAG: hypothetical protein AAGA54_15465 [Myxococcota bacterium]